MANQDYGEVLCQAVDEIIKKRLEGISYDSTVLCTITDNSRKDEGIYVVSNGSTKFEACSSDNSYQINDNVYVQIPGGDWNQQKTILAKKKDKIEEPFIYKKPFDLFVNITGNMITQSLENKIGLIANSTEEIDRLIWTYNIEHDDTYTGLQDSGQPHPAYTRLGIMGDFQSWLNPFYDERGVGQEVCHGDYGLKLVITASDKITATQDSDTNSKKTSTYDLYLNCADMMGNPYDFQSFYHQEKVFDISSLGAISKMELYFYQTPGSFLNENKTASIPEKDFLGNPIAPNLFITEPHIALGYDVNEFENNYVTVYTLDTETYSRTIANNTKNIHMRWIHEDEHGYLESVTSNSKLAYSVYWYKYKLGAPAADEYSGVYWQYYACQKSDGNGINYELWNGETWIPVTAGEEPFFTTSLTPDVTLAEEKIKAIVIYEGRAYRSNILTLINEKEVVSKPTVDAVQALSIMCVDKEERVQKDDDQFEIVRISSYGNYRIYGQNGQLLDSTQKHIKRKFVPFFKAAAQNDNEQASELGEADSIEWIIPYDKTMIVIDANDYKDTDIIDNRIHIKRQGINGQLLQNSLSYTIKGYYSQSYSNNTIQCKITRDEITYTATKELTFGVAGTTGTDYTLLLDFDNGVTALTLGEENAPAVTVTAHLYDYENKEIDIPAENEIKWSWKEGREDGDLNITCTVLDEKKHRVALTSTDTIAKNNYNILQAELTWGGTAANPWKLVAYLPIPVRSSSEYAYISGTTEVIYNSAGEIIACARNPYVVYNTASEKINNVTWECKNNNLNESAFTPTLRNVTDATNRDIILEQYLVPLSFFVEDACKKICITATVYNDKTKKTECIWQQPILLLQNKYPSAMLNSWDGELKIDDSSNSIFAARMVAGLKENDNTFSGIVLGNWGNTNSDESLTSNATGFYGFDHGKQAYGFKQNGTAFIGKVGAGRIEFNGNSSTIKSSSDNGMTIDLDDGKITAKKFTLSVNNGTSWDSDLQISTNKSIYIDTTNKDTPLRIGSYFSVKWDGTLHAAKGTFTGDIYARSGELGSLKVTGTLSGGYISGTSISGGSISIGSANSTTAFSVSSAGYLSATGANITGTITATTISAQNGSIGGWTVNKTDGLKSGNYSLNTDGTMTMGSGYGAVSIGNGAISMGTGTGAVSIKNGTITLGSGTGQIYMGSGLVRLGQGAASTVINNSGLCAQKVSIYTMNSNGELTGTSSGHLGYVTANFPVWENIQSTTGIGVINSDGKHMLKVTNEHIGATDGQAYWTIRQGVVNLAAVNGSYINIKQTELEMDASSISITGATTINGNLTVTGSCSGIYATLA